MSKDDRFARLREIVLAAAELPDTERVAYLDGACGDDPDLRREAAAHLARLDDDDVLLETGGAAKLLRAGGPRDSDGEATAFDGAPGESDPEKIGPYWIRGELGAGGMGIVYRAEQMEPIRREVALKLIKLGMDTREVIARFESERQAVALMDHPNIAQVFAAGSTEFGRPYFVMEYVRGIPITEYCDERRLSIRERLSLFLTVCGAVHHAHQKGIIHRDLKPSNILVATIADEPVPKVIDFGIAKATGGALTEKTLLTEQGQFIGTPEYMSPEQANSGQLDIDTRADVYALGVLLYELLTGALPFASDTLRGKGLEEVQRVIREVEAPRPSTKAGAPGEEGAAAAELRRTTQPALRRRLAGELDWIVLRALEKDRTRRYESAAAFGDDIRRHLANEAVVARPQTGMYRLRKMVARNRLAFTVAAGIVVLLAGFGISMSVLYARAVVAERKAADEGETATEVASFLVDLFEVSDPGEAMGSRVTAREILDQGASRIESELADRPAVQATMMSTIGVVYQKLGLYDEARPLLEKALATRQSLPGADPLETAGSLFDLGSLHLVAGRYDESRLLLERALAMREELLGPDDPEVARAAHGLATLLWETGESEEAEKLLDLALAIMRKAEGEESSEYAEVLDAMAVIIATQGRIDEAAPYFEQALQVRRKVLGEEHLETALGWSNLGMLRRAQGKPDESVEAFECALAIREKILGPDHVDVALVLNNLGLVDNDEGRYEQAEMRHRRAFAIREATLGPDHALVGQSCINIAYAIDRLGRVDEAVALYERALGIYREAYGIKRPEGARLMNDIAYVLEQDGRDREALPWRLRNVKACEALEGEEGRKVATALLNLGRNQARIGRSADAEDSFRRALAICVREFGDDAESTEEVRRELHDLTG